MRKFKGTIFSIFSIFIFSLSTAHAADIEIKIRPVTKITTSNVFLAEGDRVNFVITSPKRFEGERVHATITSIVPNSWACYEASVFIENFRFDASGRKLKGIVFKKGNPHPILTEFMPSFFIRGGEVQIKPQKDEFILYLEDVDEKNNL